jgi:hypothetical protein
MGFAEKQVAKYEQPAMMWNVILDPKPEHQNEKKYKISDLFCLRENNE